MMELLFIIPIYFTLPFLSIPDREGIAIATNRTEFIKTIDNVAIENGILVSWGNNTVTTISESGLAFLGEVLEWSINVVRSQELSFKVVLAARNKFFYTSGKGRRAVYCQK